MPAPPQVGHLRVSIKEIRQAQLQTGNHIQGYVKIGSLYFYITGMNNVCLCQMGGVLLEAFLQRDGGKAS